MLSVAQYACFAAAASFFQYPSILAGVPSLTGSIVLDQFKEKEIGLMHRVKAQRNASITVPSDKPEKEQMYQGGVLPSYEFTQLVTY